MAAVVVAVALTACRGNKTTSADSQEDSIAVDVVPDTTVYGVCGKGTSMHSLQLVTDEGDTLTYMVDDADGEPVVKGGLLAGDRLAVVGAKTADGELEAHNVINITTLLGRWLSIDKNFEIREGGLVESSVKAESHPWTTWKICNCRLVLNADTFSIDQLGADSLYIENRDGIYAFKRQAAGSANQAQ